MQPDVGENGPPIIPYAAANHWCCHCTDACWNVTMSKPFENVPVGRRQNMQANRGKDTRPELTLRRLLHRCGYRGLGCESAFMSDGPLAPRCRAG
jgi:hypothetical protein